MRRPFIGLSTVLLLSMAVSLPAMSVHAGHYPRDVHSDSTIGTNDVRATVTDRADNTSVMPADPDKIVMQIDVYDNGTANWRIEYWIRLRDRATVRSFREFQQDVREGSAASNENFYDRIRGSIAAAETATGREMSGTGFDTNTTIRQIPQKYGVVVYRFSWRGFAAVSDQRLRVGGALEGLFIGSGEHLSISWPDEYELVEVDPTPDVKRDTTVVWHGPTEFGLNGPQLLLVDRPKPVSQFLPIGTVAIVVALVTVLVWTLYHGGAPLASLATQVFEDSSDESELLSNEEQVMRLLEEHGGRIKQQEIADELGWTTSKTSYVVTNLREEGRIETFRLGRENVLSLPDSRDVHQPKT